MDFIIFHLEFYSTSTNRGTNPFRKGWDLLQITTWSTGDAGLLDPAFLFFTSMPGCIDENPDFCIGIARALISLAKRASSSRCCWIFCQYACTACVRSSSVFSAMLLKCIRWRSKWVDTNARDHFQQKGNELYCIVFLQLPCLLSILISQMIREVSAQTWWCGIRMTIFGFLEVK